MLLRILVLKWGEDDIVRLAAALAFYTALSLAPLLLIATVVAGGMLGQEAVQQEVVARAEQFAGAEAGQAVKAMLENSSLPAAGVVTSIVALAGFLFAASNVFFQLDRALNEVWGIGARRAGSLRSTLRARLEALLTVVAVGLLLVVSPLLGLATSYLQRLLDQAFPGVPLLWSLLELAVTVTVFTLLFAVVFKTVPNARIGWRTVIVGSLVTAVLFSVGADVMAYYLENSATTSVYGAAGSLMALLLWFYAASLILLLGAEITQLYARLRGQRIIPFEGYLWASEEQDRKHRRLSELVERLRGG